MAGEREATGPVSSLFLLKILYVNPFAVAKDKGRLRVRAHASSGRRKCDFKVKSERSWLANVEQVVKVDSVIGAAELAAYRQSTA